MSTFNDETLDRIAALLKRAEAMVTALEWAGRGPDEQYSTYTFMSGEAECPVCQNSSYAKGGVRGHSKDCELARLQDDLRAALAG